MGEGDETIAIVATPNDVQQRAQLVQEVFSVYHKQGKININ